MSRAANNNNPGNLRPGAGRVLWDGQTGTDPDGFAVFKSKQDGLAAARKQVLLDYNEHGLKTPAQLATKYTATDQTAYAKHLADALGIGVNDDAKLSDPAHFATYMGQLYGNEDAKAAAPADPASEFDASADLSAPEPQGDFESAANLAPAQEGPDHLEAATGVPAPDAPPPGQADAFAAAMNAPDPTLKDTTTAAVNDILAHGGGKDELSAYFDAQHASYDPKDIEGAVAAHQAGKTYTIPFTPAADPTKAEELGAGLDRGLRDVSGTVGDAAAWMDQHLPGASWLDNKLGAATGAGNAVDQAAVSHQIADAYNAGPYANSLVAGAGRLAGNATLSAPLIMGGEAAVAPVAGRLLGSGAADYLAGQGGANLLARAGSLAARGATGGAEYGAATEGGNDQGLVGNVLTGAAAGTLGAPVLGGIGAGASKLLGAGAVDPLTAAMAQDAIDRGINVRGSQVSSNSLVRSADTLLGKMPGSGMDASNAEQRQAFTQAISRTFGEDAPALTPEVMANAKRNIGSRIGAIADRNSITDTEPLVNDLADIEHNAKGVLENPAPVHQQISNILDKIGPDGSLSGKDYQTLIRKNGPLDALASASDGAKRNIASDIRDALDDAFEQSVSPDDAAAFRAARLQYKNLMTVKDLAAKAQANGGEISPALLQGAVTRSFKDRAFSGAGELGALGNIGQRFLKPAPSSNTAENNLLLKGGLEIGKYAAGTGAAALGLHAGLPPLEAITGGVGTIAGTAAAARGLTRYFTSPGYANKLIASAVNDPAAPVDMSRLVAAGVPFTAIEANRLRTKSAPR